jgi:hypothetical protein
LQQGLQNLQGLFLQFDSDAIPPQFTHVGVQLKDSETNELMGNGVGLGHSPILAQKLDQSLTLFSKTGLQVSARRGFTA